jgi:hypothetical protein
MAGVGTAATGYGDVTLSSNGALDAGNFGDVFDLTSGDITLSFTYDGTGLVDDAGAHAWSELGVRTEGWNQNFNPYGSVLVGYIGTTVDLYADQDVDIGEVIIDLDLDYLYATYHVDDGWCMTKSALAAGDELADIPQTKKGNPIPGQFPYGAMYDPCVSGDVALDPIPLADIGFSLGDTLFVAAHADVIGAVEDCTDTVWQIGDVEVVNATTGWLENYADEFNWGDPAGPITAGPSLAVEEPAFTTPFVVGTTPTLEFPYNANYSRGYGTDIDVQWDGDLPFGGDLVISWSPGQSATEKKVVSDGFPAATLTALGTPRPGEGWFLDTYPLVEQSIAVGQLGTGTHTINFLHTQGDGTFWDWIRLEAPCERYETAWGDGPAFEGKNWATYIMFTPEPIYVDGAGVWLSTDFEYVADTFDPDTAPNACWPLVLEEPYPEGYPSCLDLDDKLILQRRGGEGEASYNLPSTPANPWANFAVWWDRDGVDPWQNDATANTGGIYDVVITLHATSDTTGEAYMTINGLAQELDTFTPTGTPAGMTFTGDMQHLVVFYGLYGYGATHTVEFRNITVTQS